MAKIMSAVSLLSSCLLLLLVCVKSRKPLAPALYVFGDSLVDAGNNNYLKSSRGKVNYKPYGTNFEGGQPTGRYTDGKTGSDYIADFLGLPLVPPILGMSKAERKKTITGVNYASGGCGIFPETGKILGCMNFDKQLDLFERTVKEDLRYQFKTPEELSQHLSMSIFLITVGSNDYINHFFVSAFERKHITPQAFSLVLIDELRKRLERLYHLGARKITVLNIGPVGCMPLYTQLFFGMCRPDYNWFVSLYNAQLGPLFQSLQLALPGSTFVQGHQFEYTNEIMSNPWKYGLRDTTHACCLTWTLFSFCSKDCIPCSNPEEHIFWDAYHPTQNTNRMFAERCFDGLYCSPNIRNLANL